MRRSGKAGERPRRPGSYSESADALSKDIASDNGWTLTPYTLSGADHFPRKVASKRVDMKVLASVKRSPQSKDHPAQWRQ
jgi:hypothetical protein